MSDWAFFHVQTLHQRDAATPKRARGCLYPSNDETINVR